jgi:hypothetical protein
MKTGNGILFVKKMGSCSLLVMNQNLIEANPIKRIAGFLRWRKLKL